MVRFPVDPSVIADLEALKRRLAEMRDDDLTPEQTAAMATEISAIRLHLKRLALEQMAMQEKVRQVLPEPRAS